MTIKFSARNTTVNGNIQRNDRKERDKLALAIKMRLGLLS